MTQRTLHLPVTEQEVRELGIGDLVYIEGIIYTSRDMGHLRMKGILEDGRTLPVDLAGMAIFHAGPVVKRVGENNWQLLVIGPTTSMRMEPYADMVANLGVRVIIGKGGMGEKTCEALKKYGGVYLQAAPGCAVKLAEGIESIKGVEWLDLGVPEALWMLKARKFGPCVVAMDSHGQSIYRDLKERAYKILDEIYPK